MGTWRTETYSAGTIQISKMQLNLDIEWAVSLPVVGGDDGLPVATEGSEIFRNDAGKKSEQPILRGWAGRSKKQV